LEYQLKFLYSHLELLQISDWGSKLLCQETVNNNKNLKTETTQHRKSPLINDPSMKSVTLFL